MIDYIQKIKNNSTPVVLFGAGDLGVLAYHALKKLDIKVDVFCDSNPKKQGKYFFEINIISPEELAILLAVFALFFAVITPSLIRS